MLARIAETSTSTRLRGVNELELGKRAHQPERRLLGRLAERVVDHEATHGLGVDTGGGGEHLGRDVVGVDDRDVDLVPVRAAMPVAIRRTSPSQSVGALHAHVSYGGKLADDGPSIAFTRPPATR